MGRSEYVEVQFIIENARQIGEVQLPAFSDFNIIQGPNQSTGVTVTNGVMSEYKGISFVLQPKKTGALIIRPAVASIDGQSMHTVPLTIMVNGRAPVSRSPGFSPLPDPSWSAARPQVDMDDVVRPGEDVQEKIRKNFFIKVDVSKTECYLGEPIVATYKLYVRLRSDSRVTRHPSLNGFSVYDMIDPADDRVSVEKLNGKNYSVHIIRKAQLIPLQPGDVVLDPVELDNNIYFIRAEKNSTRGTGQGLSDLFDRLFEPEVNGTPFTQHVVLESKPVTIHVKPLPENGRPDDFNGAVGKYSIQTSVSQKSVDTGDAAILSVMVKGTGNLPVIDAPSINWPPGMESYEVSNKENIDKGVAPLGGTKQFNYSFLCSKTGSYTIPAIRLSYFDPGSKTYKTIESDPVELRVTGSGKKKHPRPVVQPAPKTEEPGYIWIPVALLVAGAAGYGFYRYRRRKATIKAEKERQLAEELKRKTTPVRADPLQESRQMFDAGDFGRFYTTLNRSLWKAVSENLRLPASELNKLNMASGLRARGWSDEDIIRLKNLLDECELKLYTPEVSTSDMQRMMASAKDSLEKLTVEG